MLILNRWMYFRASNSYVRVFPIWYPSALCFCVTRVDRLHYAVMTPEAMRCLQAALCLLNDSVIYSCQRQLDLKECVFVLIMLTFGPVDLYEVNLKHILH